MSRPAELLSPNQVIEEMSFSPAGKQHEAHHVPVAPPPSSAPPPPPPDSPLHRDEPNVKNSTHLYEPDLPASDSYGSTGMMRPQEQAQLGGSGGGALRGDASLTPNTGRSNSAMGEGTALHQVMWRMRLVNLVACTCAVGLEIPKLLPKFVSSPGRAVLGGYLIFFAGTLCCFELHLSPAVDALVKDNFGMLQHPLSRCCYLLLLATLCVGAGGGILEAALGFILVLNALYTLGVYIIYPEYRQMHHEYQPTDLMDRWRKQVTRYAWTNPDAVPSVWNATTPTEEEKQPLRGA